MIVFLKKLFFYYIVARLFGLHGHQIITFYLQPSMKAVFSPRISFIIDIQALKSLLLFMYC